MQNGKFCNNTIRGFYGARSPPPLPLDRRRGGSMSSSSSEDVPLPLLTAARARNATPGCCTQHAAWLRKCQLCCCCA